MSYIVFAVTGTYAESFMSLEFCEILTERRFIHTPVRALIPRMPGKRIIILLKINKIHIPHVSG